MGWFLTVLVQLNVVIRNFLVTLKLFLTLMKLAFGHKKWFLITNLFLIKLFLITKSNCTLLYISLYSSTQIFRGLGMMPKWLYLA